MENIRFPIIATTLYLLIYTLTMMAVPFAPLPWFLFGLSPLPVIWMVYRVLRFGVPSGRTFTDSFYDDVVIKPVSENVSAEEAF